jgi:hypothetical protein
MPALRLRSFSAAALALAGVLAGRTAAGDELIVVIRSGALDPAEREPDAAVTPVLRRLALEGALMTRVSFSDDAAAGETAAGEAAAREPLESRLRRALLPDAVLEHLRQQGISSLILDARAPAAEAGSDLDAKAPAGAKADGRALATLHEVFGKPPAVGPEEIRAVEGFRRLLEPGRPIASSAAAAEQPAAGPAPGSRLAERAGTALKRGARLAVIIEAAAEPAPQAEAAAKSLRERETLLGEIIEVLDSHPRAHLLVLGVPSAGAAPLGDGAAVLRGPRVRAGWVLAAPLKGSDLTPAALWILGSKDWTLEGGGAQTMEQVIHEILRF